MARCGGEGVRNPWLSQIGHAVLGVRDHTAVGVRRLAAVLVATACVLGSARLWSDALAPAAVPFVEPLASGGGPLNPLIAAPRTVVIATDAPPVRHVAPKVMRQTHTKAAPVATPRVEVVASAPAAAASAPHAAATTAPAPKTPKVQPLKAKPSKIQPPAAPTATPKPSPPPAVAASAPVDQVAAAPAAAPPVEPPAQPSETRPGHGYGDKNHAHSGPPGQQGS